MGSSVNVEDVKAMDPDVVVVATGARGGTLRADKEDCSVPVFDIFSAMDRPAGEWIGEVAMQAVTTQAATPLSISPAGGQNSYHHLGRGLGR